MVSDIVNNLLFFRYSSSNLRTGVSRLATLCVSDLRVAFRLGMAKITTIPTTTIRPAMKSTLALIKLEGSTHLWELFLQEVFFDGVNMIHNEVT